MKLQKLLWNPSPNFSARTAKMDLIIIHDCQGGYAGSIATFKGGKSEVGPVSAHYVLKEDGSEATQMVAIDKKAWHCCSFNSRSIGIEMAGWEAKGYAAGEWGAAATMTAYLCHKYGIPVRWAEGGVGPGIARHFDLGRSGGGHQDPTLDTKVWLAFLQEVKVAYAAGGFPETWVPDKPAPKPMPAPKSKPINVA